ncbi:MAG TPA: NfeD family protein [Gemmatimonadaceae bacterium]|nr:NfeD family protein [Gemmatimonadaceae bacterium]
MVLRVVFLIAFTGGLVLAVFAMLHGVEHLRRNRSRAPSPFFNFPAVAAFAVGLGAVGYMLSSRTTLHAWVIVILAVMGAGLAASGMIALLARWALRKGSAPSHDELETIQGQLGTVTEEIGSGGTGTISYEYLGKRLQSPARAISNQILEKGADVVIDRIEDGIAFVEAWAVVEQRL